MLSLPNRAFEHGVLVAVSGGADSVALLHLLALSSPSDGKLAVAHVNHGLRGTDSDTDAAFVQSLTEEYGLRFFEYRIAPTQKHNGSLSENSARNLRYNFLVKQAEQIGIRYVATAHTADDQTETVLHRIFRGTGLAGLSGMTSSRTMTPAVTLLRPLLHVRRKEILAYLTSVGKTFRQDKTNFENQFTRNRIRNQLLPMLRKEFNPQIDESICRLAVLASENESVLDELTDALLKSALVEQLPHQVVLNVLPLKTFSMPVLRNILVRIWKRQHFPMREMDFAHWSALAELFQSRDKQLEFPGGILATRTQHFFVLIRDRESHEQRSDTPE